MTTRCVRARDRGEDAPESEHGIAQDSVAPDEGHEDGGAHLQQRAMDLMSSYFEALETSPARLYDQERQEVHSGLVSRAGRDVIAVLGTRDLWCMEHGAHIGRMLVEVRVYLRWMALQDPSIYAEFQQYGAGKAKLYARIMKEVPLGPGNSSAREGIKEFERLGHNDGILDHRIVDTRDSFANGKSLRLMAEESGLIDLYRQAYSVASGVSHSEWWSVETHCMERCLNVLHRGHLIPSLSLSAGGNVDLAHSWVMSLYSMIRMSLDTLETDVQAVKSAFAWLHDETPDDPAVDVEEAPQTVPVPRRPDAD